MWAGVVGEGLWVGGGLERAIVGHNQNNSNRLTHQLAAITPLTTHSTPAGILNTTSRYASTLGRVPSIRYTRE